ncbi:MAG: tetratricopeptide repeat protein [Flavobacteriales bacterium]|nr:tetratricopeptide repeat protein [Flavobacteriales bacterium]
MLKSLIFVIILLSYISSSSQHLTNIDSLRFVLADVKGTETKLKVLREIIPFFERHEADSLQYYNNKLLEIAISVQDSNMIAYGIHQIAQVYLLNYEYDSSQNALKTSIEINSQRGLAEFVRADLLKLGITQTKLGELYNATVTFQKLITSFEQIGNKEGVAMCFNNLSVVYENAGMNDAALESALNSLELKKELDNQMNIGRGNWTVARIYMKIQDYDKAEVYYLKSQEIFEPDNDSLILVPLYRSLGILYQKKGNNRLALSFFEKSNKIGNILGEYQEVALCKYEYADFLRELDQHEKAITIAQEGFLIAKATNYNDIQVKSKITIGTSYLEMNKVNKAIKELKIAEKLEFERLGDKFHPELFKLMADVYILEGNTEKALEYQMKYKVISDSSNKWEARVEITKTSLKHQFLRDMETDSLLMVKQIEESKKEKAELKEENMLVYSQRNLLILISLGLLCVACFIYYLSKKLRVRNKIRSEKEIENIKTKLVSSKEQETALNEVLHRKSKELTSYSISIDHHEQLLEDLKAQLKKISYGEDVSSSGINEIGKIIKIGKIEKDILGNFIHQFEGINPNYLERLLDASPKLTQGDLRICAMMKLNLDSHEISSVLGVSIESLRVKRYRIHKKVGLKKGVKLHGYLMNF